MSDVPKPEQLTAAVNEILGSHNLEKITLRMVMAMLCERFSVSPEALAPQKRFVRQTISEFLSKSDAPDDDNDAAAAAATTPTAAASKKRKHAAAGAADASAAPLKPVRLTGLERAVVLAEPLAKFLGELVIPRSHIPKRISAYAKEHGLQDPADGRRIVCDEELKTALNVDDFTFFSLAKIVAGLVRKPDDCDEETQDMARECEEKYLQEKIRKREEDVANGTLEPSKRSAGGKKAKAGADGEVKKRKPSGLLKPMQLSEELTAVCGESQLPRSEVLKKIWVYIRENQLKDPSDGRKVLCDDKLRAVFDGNDSVGNMGINKFLSAHMTKIE